MLNRAKAHWYTRAFCNYAWQKPFMRQNIFNKLILYHGKEFHLRPKFLTKNCYICDLRKKNELFVFGIFGHKLPSHEGFIHIFLHHRRSLRFCCFVNCNKSKIKIKTKDAYYIHSRATGSSNKKYMR